MSDHDPAPDPMDKAYAQAEAVLSDDSARAARRARVLAAVAREPAAPPVSSPPVRRPAWRYGGWLAAASVAAVSLFVATQIHPPAPFEKPPAPPMPAPTAPAVPPAAAPEVAAAPTPAARAPAQPSKPAPLARDLAPVVAPPPPVQAAEAPAAPPAEARATPPAAKRTPPPSAGVSEVVVTGSRIESSPADVELRSAQVEEMVLSSPATLGARLHAAAAAGRTAEVAALLAKGVPVDAPDDDSETALMKSIQAGQPATAALLRRRGASLDLKNHAGVSARDMATSIDDPKLNRALGLGR